MTDNRPSKPSRLTPQQALNAITVLLDGEPWTPATLDAIAAFVQRARDAAPTDEALDDTAFSAVNVQSELQSNLASVWPDARIYVSDGLEPAKAFSFLKGR